MRILRSLASCQRASHIPCVRSWCLLYFWQIYIMLKKGWSMNRRFLSRILVVTCAVLFLTACSTTPKLYFGQPAAAFNSKTVERLLPVIQREFPDWEIENPNQEKHQQGYRRWKEKTGIGMDYYFKSFCRRQVVASFSPFPTAHGARARMARRCVWKSWGFPFGKSHQTER